MRILVYFTNPIVYLQYFRSIAALCFFGLISRYDASELSIVISLVLLLQIIESFFTSGVDYQFKRFKKEYSREKIRYIILNIRIYFLFISFLLYTAVSIIIGFWDKESLVVFIILFLNSFFLLGYYFEVKSISLSSLFAYSFSNIVSLLLMYFYNISYVWFLFFHFSLIPLVSIKDYFIKFYFPNKTSKIFLSMLKYWQVHIFTLSYTNLNIFMISYLFAPQQVAILFYVDKLRSVFLTVLVPLNKLSFKNSLNKTVNDTFVHDGVLKAFYLGLMISFCLVIFFPIYQIVIATSISIFEWWFFLYFFMPLPVSISLFLAYVCLTNLSQEVLLRNVYFKIFLIYLCFMPVIVSFRENYLVAVAVFFIEIITALMLYFYVKKVV